MRQTNIKITTIVCCRRRWQRVKKSFRNFTFLTDLKIKHLNSKKESTEAFFSPSYLRLLQNYRICCNKFATRTTLHLKINTIPNYITMQILCIHSSRLKKIIQLFFNVIGEHHALFRKAMNHWENFTCVSFVPKTPNDESYIVFTIAECGLVLCFVNLCSKQWVSTVVLYSVA